MNKYLGASFAGLLLAGLPLAGLAQSSNPVADALRSATAASARKMVAAAAEMPAAKFGFKPTPESMSFGQLTLHIATSNDGMCQWVSGAAPAPKVTLTPTSPKDQLVAALKDSFDYCQKVFTGLDDAKLSSQVPSFGGRKVTQAALIISLTQDWADHYSQQAAYLRLNGMLPPTAQRARGRSQGVAPLAP